MEQFNQRKLFVKKNFIFKDEGVEMFTKDIDGEYSRFIHYNSMEPRSKTRIYTEMFPRILQSGTVICALSIIKGFLLSGNDIQKNIITVLVGLGFGGLTILSYYLIRIKYYLIELDDETQMFIIYNKPSLQKMQEFIDEVYERRKQFYRKEYFYVNYKSTIENEIGRMDWLRSENIISENEYNVIVDEINDNVSED